MKQSIPVLVTILAFVSVGWCGDEEKKLKAEEVPKAVMATMTKAAADAKLGEFEEEKKGDKVVYTAVFKDAAGKEQEVTVAADGKLISVEAEEGDEHDGDEEKGEKGEHHGK